MSSIPTKNEIIISPDTISTLEIEKYFDISDKELKNIFLELQWIKKKYFLWLSVTELGKKKGAKKENKKIAWKRDILGDKELISAIKEIKSINDEPPFTLESYKAVVYKKYKEAGYTLWDYGKEKGSYNQNIDLLAKKNREVLLIRCIIIDRDVHVDEIVTFRAAKKEFLENNPIFENYNLKAQLVMTHFSLTKESFEYLQENKTKVFYEVLK